jgi:amidase
LCIDAVERVNPMLNAVITRIYDKARDAANGSIPDGPCQGVPMLLKDLGARLAGDPMYAGMKFLRDAAWTARRSHLRLKSDG